MRTLKNCLPLSAFLVAALLCPFRVAAQVLEVGGGYTYVRSNVPPGGCGCFSMNGGNGWA